MFPTRPPVFEEFSAGCGMLRCGSAAKPAIKGIFTPAVMTSLDERQGQSTRAARWQARSPTRKVAPPPMPGRRRRTSAQNRVPECRVVRDMALTKVAYPCRAIRASRNRRIKVLRSQPVRRWRQSSAWQCEAWFRSFARSVPRGKCLKSGQAPRHPHVNSPPKSGMRVLSASGALSRDGTP